MGMLIRRHRDRHDAPSEQDGDGYDDLTDEEVAEAYATNVGGQATSRRGQIKALRKLDAEAVDEGKAPDAEADKTPPTEDDPGAGGDNPQAPEPSSEGDSDADQPTEGGSDSE